MTGVRPSSDAGPGPGRNSVAKRQSLLPGGVNVLGRDGAALLDRIGEAGSLGEALGIDAEMLEALYARAFQFLRVGHAERAKGLFFALCALDGGQADNWLGYGICLRARGEKKLALAAFELATKLAPEAAGPQLHRLELLVHLDFREDASAALKQFDETVRPDADDLLVEAASPFRVALEMRED